MKNTIIQDIDIYLRNIIESSLLNSYLKIKYTGLISPNIERLKLEDIPININEFLIQFFQIFYFILNVKYKPNEILHMYDMDDLLDHFYIFLQFLQEIC